MHVFRLLAALLICDGSPFAKRFASRSLGQAMHEQMRIL